MNKTLKDEFGLGEVTNSKQITFEEESFNTITLLKFLSPKVTDSGL